MGYPRENLAPGEVVVIHRHPHWKSLLLPVLTFWMFTGAAGVAIGYTRASSMADDVKFWFTVVIGVLWLLAAAWFLARPLLSWKTTHFVVTDRRVIYRNGILTRSGIDIPIRRINTVEFRHGLVDRMLRTGTLVIESASDEPLSFHDIPQVEAVHAQLYQELLDEDDEPDTRSGEFRYDDREWRR
ncbi:PH domain-containing protein [Gordonia neofelifaecis]|uniref:Membrane-flanked domain-containing protein n=1 Tax=Gordonia neofelifaecis NRRL B-59395 TaxID=644548 RepID=F1YF86_9ACTN|nr:PH domain-containing protein [Gordonia neofelifaecis]EGD56625.1 membrane-flanked domain-containing protein [Gordonia neofelifaecis NRRL B-59395]